MGWGKRKCGRSRFSTWQPKPKGQRLILRPYQEAAVCAVYQFLRNREGNPCVVMPTGSGKTPVIARITHDAVKKWGGRVMVLSHVKELLQQAADRLTATDSELDVGVYSAGLGKRDKTQPVIVAGIQSVYKRACDLGRFDLIIVDEAHLIPPDGDGMYRTFLADMLVINPDVRLIGLTATPYRLSSGFIYGDDDCILTDVAYEVGVRELVIDGYLSALRSKRGMALDTSALHVKQGEFVADETEALMMGNVAPAVDELLMCTLADRKSVLVFCAGVAHAVEVANRLARAMQSVACVFGDTPDAERAKTLTDFKAGKLKYLVNVNVLTTGFDAPNVDCVALFRPTLSPGLYYQMVGRGFRLAEGKADCLILDFGGNVERHGPVDEIKVRPGGKRDAEGEAPAKTCPQCQSIIAAGYAQCPDCGHEFPRAPGEKHEGTASETAPLSIGEPDYADHQVSNQYYSVHKKRNAPDTHPTTLKVEYSTGIGESVSEWVCIEHEGFAGNKARGWWERMSDEPFPESTQAACDLGNAGKIKEVVAIRTKTMPGSRFPEIVNREIGDFPAPKAPDEWDEWQTKAAGHDAAQEAVEATIATQQTLEF